jgi:hypothetical protein
MSKMPFLAAALLAVAVVAIPVSAQEAKKEAPVKPADSPSKVVLDSWNDIGRKLIAMAEDFPEDKYDYNCCMPLEPIIFSPILRWARRCPRLKIPSAINSRAKPTWLRS